MNTAMEDARSSVLVRVRDAALRFSARPGAIALLRDFDKAADGDGDLPNACRNLIEGLNVAAVCEGDAIPADAAAIVYSRLGGLLDPFLLPLACEHMEHVSALHCRPMAALLGPRYSRHVFDLDCEQTLASRGRWQGPLLSRGCAWSWRIAERCLPRREAAGDRLSECRDFLRDGGRLCLFPAGVLGDAAWGDLLGELLLDYLRDPSEYRRPLVLCPVGIHGAPQSLSLLRRDSELRVTLRRTVVQPERLIPLRDVGAISSRSVARLLADDYFHRHQARFSDDAQPAV